MSDSLIIIKNIIQQINMKARAQLHEETGIKIENLPIGNNSVLKRKCNWKQYHVPDRIQTCDRFMKF